MAWDVIPGNGKRVLDMAFGGEGEGSHVSEKGHIRVSGGPSSALGSDTLSQS